MSYPLQFQTGLGRGRRKATLFPSPIRLEPTRGERRRLIRHPVLDILEVRLRVVAVRTDWVAGITQIDGLREKKRTDGGERAFPHRPGVWALLMGTAEQGDRRHMI